MDAAELTQHAATTALFAKAAVDVYRKSPIPSPSWALPVTALLGGVAGNFVVNWYEHMVFDLRGIVFTTMVGLLGGAGAIAVTELHEWVRGDGAH